MGDWEQIDEETRDGKMIKRNGRDYDTTSARNSITSQRVTHFVFLFFVSRFCEITAFDFDRAEEEMDRRYVSFLSLFGQPSARYMAK